MRTIKDGVPPSDRLFVGTCPLCGWQAEAPKKELSFDGSFYCTCPTKGCGQRVYFYPYPIERPEQYIDRSGLKYDGGKE